MVNYNTYIDDGIDFRIKLIQDALFKSCGFTNVDFYGRVQKVLSKDLKSLTPEVQTIGLERKEVFYDDKNAPGGNVFFVEEDDKHTTRDGIVFVAKIKIVFMLNLEKIYPNETRRTDSQVQDHCVKLIKRIKGIEITAIEKGIKNILKDFNTENIKLNDMQPFHIFSINGNLKYMFNCKN